MPLLKLEHYEKGKPLYCWAISAKRYALFNIAPDKTTPIIRKASMHGLGQYVDPYNNDYIRPGSRITADHIKETGLKRWHLDVWDNILRHAIDRNRLDFNPAAAKEFNIPAACRYAATSPGIMRWLDGFNKPDGQPKPLADQIRPFGFILAYRFKHDTEQFVLDVNADGVVASKQKAPRILSPFSKNIKEAAKHCFDCNNPDAEIHASQLVTLQEALEDYNLRSESKFLNGRPFDKGLTQRRHVEVLAVHYTGKEANLIDEQTYLGAMPDAQVIYGLGKAQRDAMFKEVCDAIKVYGSLRLAKATGRSRQHIHDIYKGKTKPSNEMLLELHIGIKTIQATAAVEISFEQSVLKQAREAINSGQTTIAGLAEATQCDASNLAKVISGKKNITQDMAERLTGFMAENTA